MLIMMEDVTETKEQEQTETVHEISAETEVPERDGELLVYEVGYHLVPSMTEEGAVQEATAIRAMIEKEGGIFISEEAPKRMALAYIIAVSEGGKKQRYKESYFGSLKYTLPKRVLSAVRHALLRDENIIRFRLLQTVREDTRAPKHIAEEKTQRAPKTVLEPLAIERRTPVITEEKPRVMLTDEEIDKTIEELIAE